MAQTLPDALASGLLTGLVTPVLDGVLRTARITPRPDPTGLGLVTLAVEPGQTVAALTQRVDLPALTEAGADALTAAGLPVDLAALNVHVDVPEVAETFELSRRLTGVLDGTLELPASDAVTGTLDGTVELSATQPAVGTLDGTVQLPEVGSLTGALDGTVEIPGSDAVAAPLGGTLDLPAVGPTTGTLDGAFGAVDDLSLEVRQPTQAIDVSGSPARLELPVRNLPLQTLAELIGVELSSVWSAEPAALLGRTAQAATPAPDVHVPAVPPIRDDLPGLNPDRPAPGDTIGPRPVGVSDGALVPISLAPLGLVPADGLPGLLASFLPVPPVTTAPAEWRATVKARLGVERITGQVAATPIADLIDVAQLLPDAVVQQLSLAFPTIPVPPILALFVGRRYGNPVLILTPLDIMGHSPDALVAHCSSVLQQIERVLRLIPHNLLDDLAGPVAQYTRVATALRAILRVLGGPNVRVLVSRQEPNLNLFDLQLRRLNDTEADNVFSSFAYFGLPGTSVDLHLKQEFSGARLRVGISDGMATEGRLVTAHPLLSDVKRANPAGGVLEVEPGIGRDDVVEFGFGNRISSFRFNGILESPLDREVQRLSAALGI
ncbi:MAG: hypothetical protein ACR2IR_11590 [Acidimicrobiia bacterium]